MTFLLIIIAVLSVSLILVIVKYRVVKMNVDISLQKADEIRKILSGINVYYLFVDTDFVVLDTNYYTLNKIPSDDSIKKVGNLLHCRNAIEAGECGKHVQCKLCCIRLAIGKAFARKSDIKQLKASMKLLNKDRTEIIPCDVTVSGTYLNMNGKERMVLTVCDTTELMNMERLLCIERQNAISADKLKSAFIANMSHEVRTPLNAIVGFSGLMVSATSDEEKQMYYDIISQNNERLLRLVNDIFDLSQIEAGTSKFEYTEFDVNDLLRELNGIFLVKQRENPEVGFICESHMEPIMIHSERQRVLQVMTNFLHNATKFTKEGEIRFGCQLQGEEGIRFYVSDTGIGIPEDVQSKIFNRFMKLDREMPGTGLGLALSQTIVENLGGEIGVESEIDKGSTFWFSLPQVIKS